MKVLIATPMYNGQCTAGYAASMIQLFKEYHKYPDIELEFMYGINEALVTYARNMCANIFLKSDATHLLFIDADIQFNSTEVLKMIQTKNNFVCGIYPKKKINWEQVKSFALQGAAPSDLQSLANEYLFEPSSNALPNEQNLIEIQRCGTGMMMIGKTVFETLLDKVDFFNLVSPVQSNIKFKKEENYKEFFFTSKDPNNNIFLNEDFTFCDLWRSAGGKIYGAPWVKLYHIGNHTFG
jgi:hypothetical protein